MTSNAPGLVALAPSNKDALARGGHLLSRAFFADPLMTRLAPSGARRRRGLPAVFTACLRHAARRGGVLEAPDATAVIGWLPLRFLDIGARDTWASGYVAVPFAFGIQSTYGLLLHDGFCDRRVRALAPEDSGYIYVVGVEPELAGRGLGSRLVEGALKRIAQDHAHCVLRTEQPRNVRLYERLGFECVEHTVVPSSGMPTWIFKRSLADLCP